MRRTFQDLAREANVKDIVTRSISGHATDEMQRHYSTVDQHEIRDAIERICDLRVWFRTKRPPKVVRTDTSAGTVVYEQRSVVPRFRGRVVGVAAISLGPVGRAPFRVDSGLLDR